MLPSGQQLLSNPNFSNNARGWSQYHAKTTKVGKQHCVELTGNIQGAEPWSALAVTLRDVPNNQKLHFSCSLKIANSAGNVIITAYAFNSSENVIQRWQTSWYALSDKWTTFEAVYVAPEEAKGLWIWIQNFGKMSAYVKDAGLVTGTVLKAFKDADSHATSVLEVNYQASVVAIPGETCGRVTFPIPALYREQIPITFEVSTNPRSALNGYKVYPREDGINWLCQVDVEAPAPVTVNWKALVLVSGQKRKPLKKTVEPVPEEFAQWLRSTACVQSSGGAMIRKARQLARGTNDLETIARNIMEFVAKNQRLEGETLDGLDAKRALTCGGSCTSRANLAAALLRANGIAARTVAHIPLSYSWMDEHWMTEYWHPGTGWISLETSSNDFEPSPNSLVVLAVASAEDENKSLDPFYLRTIMPGAPYLACFAVSPELTLGYGHRQNFAGNLGYIKGTKRQLAQLLTEAKAAFNRIANSSLLSANCTKQTNDIISAAQSGSALELAAALRRL